MGLKLRNKDGTKVDRLPPITQFLNRMLALEISIQNALFDRFDELHQGIINDAKLSGVFEMGVEDFKADKIVLKDTHDIYVHERTHTATKLKIFTAYNKIHILNAEDMQEKYEDNESFEFCKNNISQQIFAVVNGHNAVDENGKPYKAKVLIRPNTTRLTIKPHEFYSRYEPLTITQGAELWNEKLKTISDIKEEQLNLITGALLPIWGKLPTNNNKVYRLKDENEDAYLGVVIGNEHIDNFLNDLHNREAKTQTVEEHVNSILNGHDIEFANNWRITSKVIMGEARIEVLLPLDQTYMKESISELKENCGAFTEIINYQIRTFLPTNNLAQALTYLTGAYHIK